MFIFRRNVFLIFSVLLFALTGCVINARPPVETVNGTPIPIKKTLGTFYPIEGTQYQLASIATEQNGGSRDALSELFSQGRSDYGVYNYVFFDTQAENVHALLSTNTNLILSIEGYPPPKNGEMPKQPIAWWSYSIVKEDTNDDGKLSYLDKKTLAISDVGGNDYTEIVTDVDGVLADVFKDGNILLIIYRASEKNFLTHVDLSARKVTKTTELPSFGEDVK